VVARSLSEKKNNLVAARWFWNDLVAIRSPSEIKHNLMAAKSPGEKKKK